MDQTLRNFLAFSLAPLVVPVVLTFVLSSSGYPGGAIMIALGFSLFFSYLGMMAVGVPVFLFCMRRGLTSASMAVLVGFVTGGVIYLLFFFSFGVMLGLGVPLSVRLAVNSLAEAPRAITAIQWMVGIASLGALVGLVFWLIARPDTANDRSGPQPS